MKTRIDKELIRNLRDEGLSYRKIAEKLGCSRQYCEQAVHDETVSLRNKEYREKNKEKCRQYSRDYYQRNKDHIAEMQRAWKAKNPGYSRDYSRKYRLKKKLEEEKKGA